MNVFDARVVRRPRLTFPLPLLLVFAAGCGPTPQEVSVHLQQALMAKDTEATLRWVHGDYSDPLGNRARLQTDLRDLDGAFSRVRLALSDLSGVEGSTPRERILTGRQDAEWVGDTTWRVVGPAQWSFVRDDGWRLRGGLLSHFRDIRGLADARRAALENNDPAAMGRLLHPDYRDGLLDADEARARLAQDLTGAPIRLRVTNYRLELRGPIAHLDEHYVLTVAGQQLPPKIARFTLQRSAGRWRIKAGLYPPPPRDPPQ